jgi:hypothetical protein
MIECIKFRIDPLMFTKFFLEFIAIPRSQGVWIERLVFNGGKILQLFFCTKWCIKLFIMRVYSEFISSELPLRSDPLPHIVLPPQEYQY